MYMYVVIQAPLKFHWITIVHVDTGRTHRSNQVSAPEYLFLISELAGEQRFASTVSKRLESLVSSFDLNDCK